MRWIRTGCWILAAYFAGAGYWRAVEGWVAVWLVAELVAFTYWLAARRERRRAWRHEPEVIGRITSAKLISATLDGRPSLMVEGVIFDQEKFPA
jgi:hypothetical protein